MFSLRPLVRIISCVGLLHAVTARNFFERLDEVPTGWKLLRSAKTADQITLRLSLRQQNVDKFYQTLSNISTPDHYNYGQHLQGHEIQAMLKPTEETSDTVTNWLQNANITSIRYDGDWITLKTDVSTANTLLDTEFQWYSNELTNSTALRTLDYSVPKNVAAHINFIQPTTKFGKMRSLATSLKVSQNNGRSDGTSRWRTSSNASKVDMNCNETITPQCILELYNVDYKGYPSNGNKVGYASFLNEYARYSDLETFQSVYANYSIGGNFSVVQFNGGGNNQSSTKDSSEANLDNQYILSVGYPTPVVEFSTGGVGELVVDGDSPDQDHNSNEPYLEFLLALLKLPNDEIPQTISISYGENEQEIPVPYALQVCQLFAQLGARGVSVLVASGDFGTGDFCLSNDGTNTTKFQPIFPASCPYVTAVGGTTYIEPEQGSYFSSGGFSNIWPRPTYQDVAASNYLEKIGNKNAGLYNPTGRGFPDVAAQSMGFEVVDGGEEIILQGTSCAAPTFTGIVSLLNSARLSNKLPPLGFLNPWIYTIGHFGLNDITLGASLGCSGKAGFNGEPNGGPVIAGASWNATNGWDPVTGYGTPDFEKLLKLSTPWAKNTGGELLTASFSNQTISNRTTLNETMSY